MENEEQLNYDIDTLKNMSNRELIDIIKKIRKPYNPERTININICSNCGGEEKEQIDGYNICKLCGTSDNIIITDSQEWRNYHNADTRDTTGIARCSTTQTDYLNNYTAGSYTQINGRESKSLKQAIKIQQWGNNSYDDNILINAFNNMHNIAANHGITLKIVEEAKIIYKKIVEYKTNKKTNKNILQAVCMQWACSKYNNIITYNDIALMFNISIIDLRKTNKYFTEIYGKILADETMQKEDNKQPAVKSLDDIFNMIDDERDTENNPINYINKMCSRLEIGEELCGFIKRVCVYCEDNEILNKHVPLSRVATYIYISCKIHKFKINMDELINIANCSSLTLNKCITKLEQYESQLSSLFQ